MTRPTFTLGAVAATVGAAPPPPAIATRPVDGVAALADAGPTELSMVVADAGVRAVTQTRAAAVLADRRARLPTVPVPVLAVDDIDAAVAAVLGLFAPPPHRPPPGVHPTAVIAATARLADNCRVGPHAVVGDNTVLGANCVLHAHVVVGRDVTVGPDCELHPHVTLADRVTLGRRVVVHANSVIGSDGFGYRWDGTAHVRVPQIGTVVLEDDVEIGSGCCVDRARFGATVIGRGTKVDNLVQVAHNVRVGPDCLIVGQTGIAGSARLGARVTLGGQTAVRDHVAVGDGAIAAARTAIAKDVPPGQTVSGTPALPHRQSLREQSALRHLPALRDEVRRLQEQLAELHGRLHHEDTKARSPAE